VDGDGDEDDVALS